MIMVVPIEARVLPIYRQSFEKAKLFFHCFLFDLIGTSRVHYLYLAVAIC
jgi:hypothetical protein